MKITAVKAFFLEHPMTRPTGPSTYYYRTRRTLLVKIETDGGISGWGETAGFGGIRSIIEDHYAAILVGRDPLGHRRLWRELWGPNFGNGLALGGVDMALDDLRGKILGLPVAELHGGRLRERVEAYASSMGYIEGEDPAVHFPREAAEMRGRGFRAFKFRIGGQPIRDDLKALEGVRRAIGPEARLMADGNGAYTLGAAIRMGRHLEDLGGYWFEEPMPTNSPDYPGYEVLTDALDIPIAACEGTTSRGGFQSAIERRVADIIQPDPSLTGGIGECLFAAELARLRGIGCMPHAWSGPLVLAATVHLVSLLPDASWSRQTEPPLLEMDTGENRFREILREPLAFRDGFVSVPTAPGLGVEVDEEKVLSFARK